MLKVQHLVSVAKPATSHPHIDSAGYHQPSRIAYIEFFVKPEVDEETVNNSQDFPENFFSSEFGAVSYLHVVAVHVNMLAKLTVQMFQMYWKEKYGSKVSNFQALFHFPTVTCVEKKKKKRRNQQFLL